MPAKVAFPGKDAAGNAVDNPFSEQLDFFRNKLNLPTERWDDIMKGAHDRAFIVAGAAKAVLLQDLNNAITKAITEGRGLQEFRKDFSSIVLKHGWTGWTGEGSAAGFAWRTNIIYQTNMATSYAAGRWKQLTDPGLLSLRPYWRYNHADGVMHPRPLHLAWNGLVLPFDHEFWKTHFAPNGWCCHCWVSAVDAGAYAKAQEEGRTEPPAGWDKLDPKTGTPVGIDKGFDYAPGANAGTPLKELVDEKLFRLDAPIGAAMYDAMRPIMLAEQQAAVETLAGAVLANPAAEAARQVIVGAISQETVEWLAAHQLAPATAEIVLQGAVLAPTAGGTVDPAAWQHLADLLDAPYQVLFDEGSGRILFVGDQSGDQVLVAELAFQAQAAAGPNRIVAVNELSRQAVDDAITAKRYQIVRGTR